MKRLQELCEAGGRYLAAGVTMSTAAWCCWGPHGLYGFIPPRLTGRSPTIRAASPGLEEYSLAAGKDLRDPVL